jgi:hypothetical protein
MAYLWRYVRRGDIERKRMAIEPSLEITNLKPHVGWRGGKPVWVAFSLRSAGEIFEDSPSSVVVCVVPPLAAIAACFEEAVQFFSGDDVAPRVANLISTD